MKLPIIEQFLSIQGEGAQSGKLAYFIRLANCNLACKFCDTKYASRVGEEKAIMVDIQSLTNEINELSEVGNPPVIVFTGGEPLLYKRQIKEMIWRLGDYEVEIETNGTIAPIEYKKDEAIPCISLRYNVSPKLISSGNDFKKAIKIPVLKKFNSCVFKNGAESIFKFVIKTDKDWEQMEKIIKKVDIPKEQVYIMPEGVTDKENRKHALKFFEKIILNGYNLSPRLHIWLFQGKKGV